MKNKTAEKILLSPVNLFVWMSNNLAETFIMSVYFCSLLPFFIHIESPSMVGGICSFGSIVMLYIVKRRESKKSSKLYDILSLIILLMGIISFFILDGKSANDYYSPIEKSLCVYMGGFGGLLMGYFILGMIESEQHKRNLERRIENKNARARISIPESASVFNTPSEEIPIRSTDGERIIGHINKPDYNEFIYKNIIRNENKTE